MTLSEKIQSIKQTLNGTYVKPEKEKVEEYKRDLENDTIAQDYLKITRGINQETINNFSLGYDKTKHAISIPVYKRGELINIRYRFIDPKDKQKYTQEKGCEVWLYNEEGIARGQAKGGVLIVEGEFDLMSCWQAGIKNVVSPASGKDSYGVWLELLDSIPKVYICYDNDKPGKKAGYELSERVGMDKCFEVIYPNGIKDANEYFKSNDVEKYKELIRLARPYYKYTFNGVTDIIESIRSKDDNLLKLKTVPFIEFEEDWMVILSGTSNIGKTSYAMNIANELVNKNIPTLVLPFERGIKTVGKRFLQVRCNANQNEFGFYTDDDWSKLIQDVVNLPLYFSIPPRDEIKEIIAKAKRLFNVKIVIVDHLNYLVRKSDNNENIETSRTLQEFKTIAQELGVIFIIVHHIKKPEGLGTIKRKPKMEDLKGSSSIYQDPEAVIMLSAPEDGKIEVDIVKNKGIMGSKVFNFNLSTGVIGEEKNLEKKIEITQKPMNWGGSLDDF